MAEFASEVAAIEKTVEIGTDTTTPYIALVSGTVGAAAISADTRHDTIRAVVREELWKLFQTTRRTQVVQPTDVIRQKFQHALATFTLVVEHPVPQAMSYTAAVRRLRQALTRRQEPPPSNVALPTRCGPKPRTQNDTYGEPPRSPLCYHCGEASYIYLRRTYKQLGFRDFSVDAPRDPARPKTEW